ncbi:PadR family transcriptional regulator [Temperatibacter marinus]|uniref:PadR family transcriptional regulator n=1 Tax=Temperatibacter marinus TaxID=1456591 RepID=A0AA52EEK2_9PROT|nr:PadR family transcriptional regulator [Temperatibacter marinus]WND04052.1 PadR family transcriptional regulator [Temperatibacter marinus]
MNGQKISDLGYGILGLLANNPMSGYAVRQLFATTALSVYSSSPGSIYPALNKLQRLGMIHQVPQPDSASNNKKMYVLTEKGEQALMDWFAFPQLESHEIGKCLQSLMLRFSMMGRHVTQAHLKDFLKKMIDHLTHWHGFLETSHQAMGPEVHFTGRYALKAGVMQAASDLEWARSTLADLYKQ